jgi:hypothetical protein
MLFTIVATCSSSGDISYLIWSVYCINISAIALKVRIGGSFQNGFGGKGLQLAVWRETAVSLPNNNVVKR